MKPQFFLTCFALALVALLSDCKCKTDPPPPTADPRVALFDKLKGNWKAVEVTLNTSITKTEEYKEFLLKIGTDNSKATGNFPYETEKRPSTTVWNDKGDFKFKDNAITTNLIREDAIDITYTLSDGDKVLTFKFTFPKDKPPYKGGRVQAVDGEWLFKFNKQ